MSVTAEIHRQPVAVATDWQAAIADRSRRDPGLSPALPTYLRDSGLIERCCFLSASDDGPLIMRHVSRGTVLGMGLDWARAQIGKPHIEDPHSEYAAAIDEAYREVLDGGEIVLNRVTILGLHPVPLIYTQMLIGWSLPGRRAILSAVDYPPGCMRRTWV